MLLFIHNSHSPFVMNDLAYLSGSGRVNRFYFPPTRGIAGNLLRQLHLFAWLLYWAPRSEGVFCWFADLHSLLPAVFSRALGKPFWVVLGGYDAACMPEYDYGVFTNPVRGFFAWGTMRLATRCLAVSTYTAGEAHKRCCHARIEVVYNAAEGPENPISPNRDDIIATVAVVDRRNRIQIKGIDRFIETARRLPNRRFVLVGVEKRFRYLLHSIPENLEVHPPMPAKDLRILFSLTRVYCQFSRTESFGLAAVEAALHGAIPVIADAGALPEVLGGGALVWDGRDPQAAAEKVEQAFSQSPDPAWIASLRERFSPEARRRHLFETMRRSR
jgi:glycosyltransferase involved in cell wall biosynthesis